MVTALFLVVSIVLGIGPTLLMKQAFAAPDTVPGLDGFPPAASSVPRGMSGPLGGVPVPTGPRPTGAAGRASADAMDAWLAYVVHLKAVVQETRRSRCRRADGGPERGVGRTRRARRDAHVGWRGARVPPVEPTARVLRDGARQGGAARATAVDGHGRRRQGGRRTAILPRTSGSP
jgi:hypothetical protein